MTRCWDDDPLLPAESVSTFLVARRGEKVICRDVGTRHRRLLSLFPTSQATVVQHTFTRNVCHIDREIHRWIPLPIPFFFDELETARKKKLNLPASG